MAKVAFLQKSPIEWLGIMYLSSMLKSHGHECRVYVEPFEKDDIARRAVEGGNDIVTFSCLTSDYPWALNKARAIKRISRVPLTVFGGTHVTLNPQEPILRPEVDVVCQGEGEQAMLELADAVDRKADFSRIPNLWLRREGSVRANAMRDLVADLDSLPFPDRKLYATYPFFDRQGNRPLHFSRGCPYGCSYCHNARKRALFTGKGKYVRWRSMESVLAEIDEIRRAGFVALLHFIDDSFGVNHEGLKAFLAELNKREGKRLAIHANMRAETVTEDLCEHFRAYGTDLLRIRIGVECGDERFRREVLKKELSNNDLLEAARLFRKYRIEFTTYNMVGLPGETLDQAMETFRLNLKLKPTLAICFLYQPYPGTNLTDDALKNGFLSPDMLKKIGLPEHEGYFHSKSVLCQPEIEKLENLQRIFSVAVKWRVPPRLVARVVSVKFLGPVFSKAYRAFIRYVTFRRRLRDKHGSPSWGIRQERK